MWALFLPYLWDGWENLDSQRKSNFPKVEHRKLITHRSLSTVNRPERDTVLPAGPFCSMQWSLCAAHTVRLWQSKNGQCVIWGIPLFLASSRGHGFLHTSKVASTLQSGAAGAEPVGTDMSNCVTFAQTAQLSFQPPFPNVDTKGQRQLLLTWHCGKWDQRLSSTQGTSTQIHPSRLWPWILMTAALSCPIPVTVPLELICKNQQGCIWRKHLMLSTLALSPGSSSLLSAYLGLAFFRLSTDSWPFQNTKSLNPFTSRLQTHYLLTSNN